MDQNQDLETFLEKKTSFERTVLVFATYFDCSLLNQENIFEVL